MKHDLSWDMEKQPIAFNMDGPGRACSSALSYGYPACFNSGTLFWINNHISLAILREWWHFAGVCTIVPMPTVCYLFILYLLYYTYTFIVG
jgi:hypothetical protein